MYNQTDILEGLKNKDEKAFELLFKTHYEALVRFVYKYMNNSEEAEEIVQDTFYTLWEKSEKISIQSSIKSYLYQAARNKSLNTIKHKNVQLKYANTVLYNSTEAIEDDESIELDELQDKINQSLDLLPPKCRKVFELSRFEEKKYKEIAEELDISIKTVENHMGKALGILRTSLKEYLPIYLALLLAEIISEG